MRKEKQSEEGNKIALQGQNKSKKIENDIQLTVIQEDGIYFK